MNVVEFLLDLAAQDIELWATGERLRYRAPKHTLTPDLVARLQQHKTDILAWLHERAAPSTALSHGQRALWFVYQLAPASAAYNIMYAGRLEATLDVSALRQAFQMLMQRHAVLRTTYTTRDGEPYGQVHDEAHVAFEVIEASAWDERALQQWLEQEGDRPFDLEQGPIWRLHVLTFGGSRAATAPMLVVTVHHIAVDFVSLQVLMEELQTAYAAFKAGVEPSLPPLRWQFKDYVRWEADWLLTATGRLADYWQQQLAGELPVLQLPTDRPRPAVQTYAGALHPFALDPALTQRLRHVARQEGATLYTVLLTALQVLLYRYTGQDTMLIGSPMESRSLPAFRHIVGYFVNPVVLRADISGDPTFTALLQRVRQTVLGALEHQAYPFPLLVERLQLQRDPSRSPLFQVEFVWDQFSASAGTGDGLIVESLALGQRGAHTDLSVTIYDTGGPLRGSLRYNTDLFDATTMATMAEHFQTLLAGIVAAPEQSVAALPLLTAAEQQQLLVAWNDPATTYPVNACLHQLFEAQVAQSPHSIALVCETQAWSYAALNQRANRLARRLRAQGVGPHTMVGLLAERSPELVVGILGIMKAGGAYVPIDVAYPPERIDFMLKDSGAPVLLTQTSLVASLPDYTGTILCLDDEPEATDVASDSAPVNAAHADSLAYVIYTSGSTGQPKGVLVTHRNVIRLLHATQSRYQFQASDTWTLFHSAAFDFSVWELWGALVYGGRLVIVPYVLSRSPDAFYELLREAQVTVLNQTPSAFRQLIEAEERRQHPSAALALRLVIFGGEALDLHSLQPWFNQHGERAPVLVNMYGITETTVHVTWRALGLEDAQQSASLIGRPLPDLQVYILDRHQGLMPVGVPGEMYIGGAGVAAGYWQRPALTAARFLPNPYSPGPGARLYRTGDLARYVAHGDIEYLGRIDQQVKIRGFRIELGEIEATLAQHEQVRTSVVVLDAADPRHKRLVAYVVLQDGAPLTPTALRQYLQRTLPDYMLPAAFVFLEALPLTVHGKVDLRALPAPEPAPAEAYTVADVPHTPEEALLADIWSDVLAAERVGVNDNFFALGGDSIRSIEIIYKAREVGLELSVPQLFQYQTIRALTQALDTRTAAVVPQPHTAPFSLLAEAERHALPPDVVDAYPLTRLQDGMLFHSAYNQDSAVYHDIFAYDLRLPFDRTAMLTAVDILLARHAVLRTSFDMSGAQQPLQLVHEQVANPTQIIDLCHLPAAVQDEEIASWIEAEKQRHFAWSQAPLLRFCVHVRSATTLHLTVSFHHVILDGWSVASMMTEFLQHYVAALDHGVAAVAPVPATTFRDYVALERQTAAAEACQDYWQDRLRDAEVLRLPHWPGIGGRAPGGELGEHTVQFSMALSQALVSLTRECSVPIRTVLLAAHVKVLSIVGYQSDVLTGLVTNGRIEAPGGERVLGLFLNTLPFRQRVSHGTWRDLLRQTLHTEREQLPYRRYPLVDIHQLVGRSALFETVFNFTHFHIYQQILDVPGIEVLGFAAFEQTNYPLVANFNQDAATASLTLRLQFQAAALAGAQVAALGQYYTRVLEAMAAQPEAPHAAFSVLTAAERQQILHGFNDTTTRFPAHETLVSLFEQQVARTPDNVAVVYADTHLTYGELNARANDVAHYLLSHFAMRPDTFVAVLAERSDRLIAGLLGVLKAGGAYVPIDPAYPADRIAYILHDCRARVVLTENAYVHTLAAAPDVARVDLYTIPPGERRNAVLQPQPHNLAYAIYTSGSTGRPKGAMIAHDNVVRLFKHETPLYDFAASDTWTLFHSPTFDFSVWEMYGALLFGARLVIVPRATAQDPQAFVQLVREHQVTVLNQTPGAFKQFSDVALQSERADLCLRYVIFGGDALNAAMLHDWQARYPATQLVNMYGITETTVHVTAKAITAREIGSNTSNIGKPIPTLQAYIVDEALQPQPVGVPGEICVAGAGLARGYLNRAQLTATAFVANPFGTGDRLYRSGDLGMYVPDGDIVYLGRKDNQVKIRGHRIELGEIEHHLLTHPAVNAAVVVATVLSHEQKDLVAYIVPHDAAQSPTVSALRAHMRDRLPDYMMPVSFVALQRLPLTANGKIDRTALPAPSGSEFSLGTAFVAPRTDLEHRLAAIWQEVLQRDTIGVHDNFFDLGGHSLTAVRLVTQVSRDLAVDIAIRDVFYAPTITRLAEVIEASAAARFVSIEPVAVQEHYALSHAQRRVWVLHQFEDTNAAYNVPASFVVQGAFDVAALRRSFASVVERHEILRTVFQAIDGVPRQIVRPAMAVPITYVDLRQKRDPYAMVDAMAARDAVAPFDLGAGPLMRLHLLHTGDQTHILLFNMHHIITDAWSLDILVREVLHLYACDVTARPPQLQPLRLQYKDYAAWQHARLAAGAANRSRHYWHAQLAGEIPVLDLPTDRPRPAHKTFRGTTATFPFEAGTTADLKCLGAETDASLFMVLLAAVKVLAYRYTGQHDITIGSPIAGRDHVDLEEQLGLYINTLALRSYVSGDETFASFLEAVKRTTTAAYDHQDYPFDILVDELDLARDVSRSPLFDVMVSLQGTGRRPFTVPGGSVTPYKLISLASKFDLTFIFTVVDETLSLELEYNTDLFDQARIQRLWNHLSVLLHAITRNPHDRIAALPLLPPQEADQVLHEFHGVDAAYPAATLVDLFQQQVARTPDAIAVVSAAEDLSYHALNARANRLAHLLREQYGIGPDSLVGVLLERSASMIVGLLAVLKAGGAYIPMDTDYPDQRLAYTVHDSACVLVLSESRFMERLGRELQTPCVDIASIESTASGPSHNPVSCTTGAHLAYVIYTSGSTGQPKGCAVTHANVVRLLCNTALPYELSGDDVWVMAHSYCFDFSVWEMYGALLYGGKLIVPERIDVQDSGRLLDLVQRHRVTMLNQTPGAFYNFIDDERRQDDRTLQRHLRAVIFGGDRLDPVRLQPWVERYPCSDVRLVNMYGITETTVHVTWHDIGAADIYSSAGVSNVGTPLPATDVFILDANLQPVPIGVPGELYVGNGGLARGYVQRPGLSAERFLPHPYRAGERLYKTGDVGRWQPDGNIVIWGRKDSQVKIRGFRIELGEIVYHLMAHPAIKDAVVIARDHDGGGKDLVAYVVGADASEELNASTFRDYLGDVLPDYMIPAYFVPLQSLPLTTNNKIDYDALPDPSGRSLSAGAAFAAPRNETENLLVDLWQAFLQQERVGIHDHFFALGGDSIKALQIVSSLHDHDIELEIRDIFTWPTIAELAPHLTQVEADEPQEAGAGAVPLTAIQTWFLTAYGGDRRHFNQSVLLETAERFDVDAVRAVLHHLQEHHDALRTTFRMLAGEVRQEVAPTTCPLAFETVDLRQAEDAGEEMDRRAIEVQRHADLEQGPLMRAMLFQLHAGDRLLLVVHHLVIDGVSWRILLTDFATASTQYLTGEAIVLPRKSDAFAHWARLIHDYSTSAQLLDEIPYWQAVEETPSANLPYDFSHAPGRNSDTQVCRCALSTAATAALLREVPRAYNTEINDVLLTALARALQRGYGIDAILLLLEGHGREPLHTSVNVSSTVGWFTAVYPMVLRCDVTEAGHHLRVVKEQLRRTPNKGLGYGILRYITPREDTQALRFTSEPRLTFNYLGQFDAEMPGQRMQVTPYTQGQDISPEAPRTHDLDVSGSIARGQLHLAIAFDSTRFRPQTIAALVDDFEQELLALIAHCRSKEQAECTPSDLTWAGLSLDAYDALLAANAIPRHTVQDIYPLSPMQEGMLFHTVYEAASAAYFEQMSIRLVGDLALLDFEASWNEVIQRHEALRTTFLYRDLDRPLQVVLKERPITCQVRDISAAPPWRQTDIVQDFKAEDKRRSFALSQEPLLRITVFRLAAQQYEIIVSHHHIILDGWSMGLVLADFFTAYRARLSNTPSGLPPVTSYRAYVRWLEGQDREASQAFWTDYLCGYERAVAVPAQNHPEAGKRNEFATVHIDFGPAAVGGLRRLAAHNNVSMNTVVQSLWGTLLAKYNATDDVVFGATVSGRSSAISGIEQMVGLFINTTPVRLRFAPGQTYKSVLQNLQQDAFARERHDYYPLARIQAHSPLKQELFNHIVIFENYPVSTTVAASLTDASLGFRLEALDIFEQTNYDLIVVVDPGERLTIKVTYNEWVYDRQLLERIAGHLRQIVTAVLADETLKIAAIALLPAAERQTVLETFNASQAPYPAGKTVTAVFEAQVEATPAAVAVVAAEHQVTYRELNAMANQLAQALRQEYDIQPGDRVGIMSGRAERLIVAILAVLKAGGAFVPLDPAYPEARLQYMLDDAACKAVITEPPYTDVLAAFSTIAAIDLAHLRSHDVANPVALTSAAHLAYLMYTSGSTGRPKGVMIAHQGVVNMACAQIQVFAMDASDRVLQFASYAFDATISEIFTTLLCGATLVMIADDVRLEPQQLRAYMQQQRISVLTLPPSYVHSLERDTFRGVKTLVSAGEAAHADDAMALSRQVRYLNAYGPTEGTVCATWHHVDPTAPAAPSRTVPIGKPLANTQVFILDRDLQPVPVGIAGELCIAGVGLAWGYWHDATISAQKFMPHPFGQSTRLFRTGDRARWLPDGTIEYLGREDNQVKVRGFRIEPGEIAYELSTHPAVQSALVLARADAANHQRLVGYVILDDGADIDTEALRHFLAQRLPAYQLPSALVPVERWPMTPNGKIDRQALPAPEEMLAAREPHAAAPQTEVERVFADIWAAVLGLEQVDVHDNFFDLGGDSILSMQIVSRTRQAGYELSAKQVFELQTIARLASVATALDVDLGAPARPTGEVVLTPIQRWFFEQDLPAPHHWNQALVLLIEADCSHAVLAESLQAVYEHHDVLRLRFSRGPDGWRQYYAPTTGTTLECHDLSALAPEDKEKAFDTAAAAVQAGLHLEQGPLLRAVVFDYGPHEPQRLLLVLHHLVVDGVSWRILLEDFVAACRLRGAGQRLVLPRQSTSFQAWAQRLAESAAAGRWEQETPYWLDTLSHVPGPLPTDFPAASDVLRVADMETYGSVLPESATRALLHEVHQAYHTRMQEVLLTALVETWRQWTGAARLTVDLEGHGREDCWPDMELSRTLGWFTSLYPVSLAVPEGPYDAGVWLQTVKEQLRAVPTNGLGFGILRYLSPDPALRARLAAADPRPLSFNYLGSIDTTALGMDGFRLAERSAGVGQDARQSRSHALAVNAAVRHGCLHVDWSYSARMFLPKTIEALAETYLEVLGRLIEHCLTPAAGGYTPSDFDKVRLSEAELEAILDDLDD